MGVVHVRTSWVKLYAPFLVLALVQGMFIAVAPSRGGGQQDLSTLGTGDFSANGGNGDFAGGSDLGGDFDPSAGVDADGDGVADPTSGFSGGTNGTSGSSGGTSGGTSGGESGGSGAAAGGGGGAQAVAGDTSHCKDGKQMGIIRNPPPCVPKFVGNNGGATYQGVTDTEIKVVYFSSKPSEAVDAVLAPQGLATTEQQNIESMQAYFDFMNKHLETYGRKLKMIRVVGDCPTTPPDYDKCFAAAQEVVKIKPFAVIWGTSLYAEVFDVWAKNGIVTLGGQHFDESFYSQRRPFRYDTFMSGTQTADHIVDYYCKKMAKGTATHAGRNIHPTIGGRETPRKLGVVTPEIEANVLNAKRVIAGVKACGGQAVDEVFTYESDIERATEQTQATVQKHIAEKVTTTVCMCDPIAPAFFTAGLSGNSYYPEFLMPGLGLLDYDKLGRLYDKRTMEHAFGPSHLGLNIPLDDTDQGRAWRDVGNEGHPCGDNGCGVTWSYAALVGFGVHLAGPNLNPLTFEKAVLDTLPDSGGTPDSPLANYGPGDYTGLGDAKEVYWSETARSSLDNQPGAYVPVAGGKRYRAGQWPGGLDQIPVPAK